MAFDFPSSPTTGQTYSITGGPTYVYNGTAWVVLTPGNQFNRTVFTATAGQTTFSMNYVVGAVDVYRNGVKLAPADFTATNGTSIVLANGCTVGDTIEVISYPMITYSDAVTRTGDTMTGALTVAASTTQSSVTNAAALFQASQLSTSDAGVLIGSINGNTPYIASSNLNAGAGAATPLTFITSATERMRIDTAGRITMPYQPAFFARISAAGSYTLADAQVFVFNTTDINVGGAYNTSTGRFTAPISGVYYFHWSLLSTADGNTFDVRLWLNGSNPDKYGGYSGSGWNGFKFSSNGYLISLSAGDYVELRSFNPSYILNGVMHNHFSGYLLG